MNLWLLLFLVAITIIAVGSLAFYRKKLRQTLSMTNQNDANSHIEARTHRVGDTLVAEPIVSPSQKAYTWITTLFGTIPGFSSVPQQDTSMKADAQAKQDKWKTIVSGVIIWAILSILLLVLIKFMQPVLAHISTQRKLNHFTVVVTSFQDGSDGKTGHIVASELTDVIKQHIGDEQISVVYLPQTPVNDEDALRLAQEQQSDVLIWGTMRSGELLDSPSLQPRITYTPNGEYAPYAWDGYAGRFSLPYQYELATAPINGKAVIPRLVLALEKYSAGNADQAYAELHALVTEHNALNTSFFWALMGIIEWAQGAYDAATTSYQQALAVAPDNHHRTLYTINLSALLFDTQQIDAASQELQRAIELSGDQQPASWYINQGLIDMHRGSPELAANQFLKAYTLRDKTTPETPLALALAQSYYEQGNYTEARNILLSATTYIQQDSAYVPGSVRDMFRNRMQSYQHQQQGVLNLHQAVKARGSLAWELEIARTEPTNLIQKAVESLRTAVQTSQALETDWNSRATSQEITIQFASAGAEPSTMTLVAQGQAERATARKQQQSYELALALIEQVHRTTRQRQTVLSNVQNILGMGKDYAEAERILTTLIDAPWHEQAAPLKRDATIAHARLLRLRGDNSQATERYTAIRDAAPQLPEAYFGLGMLDATVGNMPQARERMQQALLNNDAYFPARVKLIDFALAEQQWAVALEHLRILAAQYPSDETTIQIASVLRQSGETGYAQAEQELTPLIQQGNAEALIERGRVRRDAQQIEAAMQDFSDAYTIGSATSASGAAFEWGQTLLALQRYTEAEQQLKNALTKDSTNTLASLGLVNIYLNNESPHYDPRKADDQYTHIINNGTAEPAMLQRLGNALLEKHEGKRAVDAFQRAVTMQPGDPALHHGLAQAYLEIANPSAAIKEGQRVLDLTSTAGDTARSIQTDALTVLGEAELQRSNPAEAQQYFTQALALTPNHVKARIGMGHAATALDGNWSVALGHFQTATQTPDGETDALALFWLAEAQLRLVDPQTALGTYEQALQRKPDFPEALLGMAQAYQALDNREQALATIQRALEIRKDYGEAWLFQCKILRQQEDTQAALAACNNAIAANNRLAEAYYLRGTIYVQQADYRHAINDLQNSVHLHPDSEAFYWLGRSYFHDNKMFDSVNAFDQAIALNGTSYSDAQFHRALALERLGKIETAITSLQTLIEDAEWGDKARQELARLGVL